jgi:hypothetical protein
VAWLRGEFNVAVPHLEAATAGKAAADQHEIGAVRFLPNDLIAAAQVHVALTHLVRGDLTGAEAEVTRTARRADQLGFPQGPISLAYARFAESWLRIEAGQLDRAAPLVADLHSQAERHGLGGWRLIGATQQASVSALAALGADDLDPTGLSAHIATMTTFVDTWRAAGLNVYLTFFDSVLARLLTAAGQPEAAREHLDCALQLAEDTGMHFYDAELLRLRAQTHADPHARTADITEVLELARRQGATLFELRSALDDFELRGEPAAAALADVVSRFTSDSAFSELARAHSALAR